VVLGLPPCRERAAVDVCEALCSNPRALTRLSAVVLLPLLLVPPLAQSSASRGPSDSAADLLRAVKLRDRSAVSRILDAGVSPEFRDESLTPLIAAARGGDVAIVDLLLAAGADPKFGGRGGISPLMAAAQSGHDGAVRSLLRAKAPVDGTDERERTALFWAIPGHQALVIETLLAAGADMGATRTGDAVDARSPAAARTSLRRCCGRAPSWTPAAALDEQR
jgi:ankyrin repeat protein